MLHLQMNRYLYIPVRLDLIYYMVGNCFPIPND